MNLNKNFLERSVHGRKLKCLCACGLEDRIEQAPHGQRPAAPYFGDVRNRQPANSTLRISDFGFRRMRSRRERCQAPRSQRLSHI